MQEIRAEIPAVVLDVAVRVGDAVRPGDELLLLESMKMEIPLISEHDGVVTRIEVERAGTVRQGDLLAVVDAGPPHVNGRVVPRTGRTRRQRGPGPEPFDRTARR